MEELSHVARIENACQGHFYGFRVSAFYIQEPVKGRKQGLQAGGLVFSLVESRFLSKWNPAKMDRPRFTQGAMGKAVPTPCCVWAET